MRKIFFLMKIDSCFYPAGPEFHIHMSLSMRPLKVADEGLVNSTDFHRTQYSLSLISYLKLSSSSSSFYLSRFSRLGSTLFPR